LSEKACPKYRIAKRYFGRYFVQSQPIIAVPRQDPNPRIETDYANVMPFEVIMEDRGTILSQFEGPYLLSLNHILSFQICRKVRSDEADMESTYSESQCD
jgi:hypothetical protein